MASEKRILIIDPDPWARRDLAHFLKKDGYTLETGKNLSEAIKKVAEGEFDCLVMDIDLPEMKGYEAVPIIKNLDPGLRIILTTKQNDKRREAKARAQDIFYYFIKSFGKDELRLAVKNVFNPYKERSDMNKSTKILVVDDDPDFRAAVTPILKSALYEVVTAANPKEAKEKILTERPNLILLDIMMDSLFDGFSLCHAVKTSAEFKDFRDTPIIFVSAVKEIAGSRFQFKGDEEGMEGPDDYIDKPVKPDDLLARIAKLLK
ncbi:MAG: response regulator [Candidatus Aminicenantes bacterium]|nr:response regulator [Candidatus Aminicenantes bacterium]